MASSKGVRTYNDACLYYICVALKCLNLFYYYFQAAEIHSTTNEQFLSFWGEELDKNVEGFVRSYSEEVYRELSCFSKRGRHAVVIFRCLFSLYIPESQFCTSYLVYDYSSNAATVNS